MNFDLQSTEFWDPEATRKELLRVFDVCHGCRVCYTLCPSFVKLFEVTDDAAGIFGNVESLSDKQINDTVDLCYQCKICDPICPYTPPHALDMDVPRTLIRYNLVRKKQEGVTFANRIFGNTDLVGRLSSYAAPIVNWANRNPLLRGVLETYLGVHRDRLLPTFYSETFEKWYRRRSRRAAPGQKKGEDKVVLFYTCTVNYNEPVIGKAAVEVFEKNGVECFVPPQQCCGLPFIDNGMLDQARKKMKSNVAVLSRAVRQGYKIVAPSASCSYMLKHDYPSYVTTEDARLVAENTYDLSEYLVKLHEEGKLNLDFSQKIGKVRYHQPCHLMAQEIGFKAQELMQLIPGTEVDRLQCCSGHDGAWSVKKEYFEESMKVGKPLFNFMKADEEACCVTDCPLSALQIEQGAGKKAIHPIVVLAQAYGLEVGNG
ncbi:MAG: anaerobic glycerol-3-phosphate dehydrogenase subunit C [Acidobacteria bacterium]|nr:anaerobic glycerol-3-phosphate dehydrogenase subunit C [Acidobacteriota bacterium]